MSYLIILPPLVAFGLSLMLGAIFGTPFSARWWLLRLGLLPLIFFIIALYLVPFPAPFPPDYDPEIHGNPARWDFLFIMIWGVQAPVAYLILALPISLAYGIWRKRKLQK